MKSLFLINPHPSSILIRSAIIYEASITHPTRRQHSTRSHRRLHSSASKDASISLQPPYTTTSSTNQPSPPSKRSPLADLPLKQLLRTYLITAISSSPTLLSLSTNLLRHALHSGNPLFNPDRNPILRQILKTTFYAQFCAGSTPTQVATTCTALRNQGYAGVILEYALEVLSDDTAAPTPAAEAADIATWRAGMLASVAMASPGDFLGLKWSGMGASAVQRMKAELPPTEAMMEAMCAVAEEARGKGIALLPSAEESWSLKGYHAWSLEMQRRFNGRGKGGEVVVYNTYQAYLRMIPGVLAEHVEIARKEGWVLGVKLVRGAYLGSEKRELIWGSIEETHDAYDGLTAAMITRRFNETLNPAKGVEAGMDLPPVKVVVASHNARTVARARALRQGQVARKEELTPLVFAQLQGMADEVSCSLLQQKSVDAVSSMEKSTELRERVFKCTTWGSLTECLNYLLRRAAENKDAAGRTADTRKATAQELFRRARGVFSAAT